MFPRLAFIAASLKFVIKKVITNTHSHWSDSSQKYPKSGSQTNNIIVAYYSLTVCFVLEQVKCEIDKLLGPQYFHNMSCPQKRQSSCDKWHIGHFGVEWSLHFNFWIYIFQALHEMMGGASEVCWLGNRSCQSEILE